MIFSNVNMFYGIFQEELAAADKDVDDPFTRRKCQPTLVTLVSPLCVALSLTVERSHLAVGFP